MSLLAAACSDDSSDDAGEPGSTDGQAIELQEVDAGDLASDVGSLNLYDVHGDDDGWLVVGSASEPRERSGAVAFASADALTWDVNPLPLPDTQSHSAQTIAADNDTVYVAGSAGSADGRHLVVWTRQSGEWNLTELDADLGQHRAVSVGDAVVVDGDLVLTGGVRAESGVWSPHVWLIGPDDSVSESTGFEDQEGVIGAIASDGNRLLASGALGEPAAYRPPALFESEDGGQTWSEVDYQGLDEGTVWGLAYHSGQWWISGTVEGGGVGVAAFWTSDDGVSWALGNDPSEQGSSHVRQTYQFDDYVVGLGTWVWRQDGTGVSSFWPNEDETRDWLGNGGVHNGRLVAIGAHSNSRAGLYVTDDASSGDWERVELADLALESADGVLGRSLRGFAGSADRLVLAGGQTDVADADRAASAFVATSPDYERVGAPAQFEGDLSDVAYVDGIGFVAVGREGSGADYRGARILVSDDGSEWVLAASSSELEDRAGTVIVLGDDALVVGMTWLDRHTPATLLWRVAEGGEIEEASPVGLDGYSALSGCGSGEIVALGVSAGDSERALALSTDRGATFTVLDDLPFAGASALECAVAPDGEVGVLAHGLAEPQVHVLDPSTDQWDETDLPGDETLNLNGIHHLEGAGWVLAGSEGWSDYYNGVAYVTPDLADWTELVVPEVSERSSVSRAAVSGSRLYVTGSEDGQPALWSVPLDAL